MIVCLLLLGFLHFAAGQTVDQQIVSGYVVQPTNRFPWQLSLLTSSHICGAVVYNANYAITAAHCVDASRPTSYTVQCGVHNRNDANDGRQSIRVSAIRVHPNYNQGSGFIPNDVAVLKLSSSFRLDSRCQPGVFPSGNSDYAGSEAIMTGWGGLYGGGPLGVQLKRGDVQVLSPAQCRNYWGTTVNDAAHICVKDLGDKIYGACNGDSGGPVQVNNVVVGLASWVATGCLPNLPSGYTRLTSYMSWVHSTVASMG